MKPSDFLFKIKTGGSQSDVTSTVTHRSPCPKCRSIGRDKAGNNLVHYKNSDGSKSSYCFSCSHAERDSMSSSLLVEPDTSKLKGEQWGSYNPSEVKADRGITVSSWQKYGVQVNLAEHVYPYFNKEQNSELVGVKVRKTQDKSFWVNGDVTRQAGLFGQHVFPKGSYKSLVITEGEVDAVSAYQMLSGRSACISVPNGAQGAKKAIQANWDYINSFETVYLCLDNDEPGKQAVSDIAPMFPSGKVKIIEFPAGAKDANDVLVNLDDPSLFNRCFNNAKIWVPDGILCSSNIWEILNKDESKVSIPYPWSGANDFTYGIRTSELITLCAGSGVGKTSFMREIAHHILKNTKEKVGMLFLEESVKKTGQSLLSIELNKPLHIPDTKVSKDELKKAFDNVLGTGRVFFYDHFGSTNIDNIVARVHYMAMVAGCKYIFLDHISIIVSSQENGDERKALDEIMTKLRTLVQQTDICLFLVTHLKRTEEGHENGGEISMNHLRGSAGIGQLSDFVVGFERNGQDPDVNRRHTTLMRVIKNRPFGLTGLCAAIKFDRNTFRLTETDLQTFLNKGKKDSVEEDEVKRAIESFQDYTKK